MAIFFSPLDLVVLVLSSSFVQFLAVTFYTNIPLTINLYFSFVELNFPAVMSEWNVLLFEYIILSASVFSDKCLFYLWCFFVIHSDIRSLTVLAVCLAIEFLFKGLRFGQVLWLSELYTVMNIMLTTVSCICGVILLSMLQSLLSLLSYYEKI